LTGKILKEKKENLTYWQGLFRTIGRAGYRF